MRHAHAAAAALGARAGVISQLQRWGGRAGSRGSDSGSRRVQGLGSQQVPHGLIVNFKHAEVQVQVLCPSSSLRHVHELGNGAQDQARVMGWPHHGVRLATARDAIGQHAGLVPCQHCGSQGRHLLCHLRLRGLWAKHAVKGKAPVLAVRAAPKGQLCGGEGLNDLPRGRAARRRGCSARARKGRQHGVRSGALCVAQGAHAAVHGDGAAAAKQGREQARVLCRQGLRQGLGRRCSAPAAKGRAPHAPMQNLQGRCCCRGCVAPPRSLHLAHRLLQRAPCRRWQRGRAGLHLAQLHQQRHSQLLRCIRQRRRSAGGAVRVPAIAPAAARLQVQLHGLQLCQPAAQHGKLLALPLQQQLSARAQRWAARLGARRQRCSGAHASGGGRGAAHFRARGLAQRWHGVHASGGGHSRRWAHSVQAEGARARRRRARAATVF